MGLRPTQGDEKRFLFSGSAIPPPCIPDRSAAQGPAVFPWCSQTLVAPRQVDPGENLDNRRIVFPAVTGAGRLQKHLVRGAGQR
jgi:hypothetical protein